MNNNSDSYAKKSIPLDIFLIRKLSKKISNLRDKIIFQLILETAISADEITTLKPKDFEFTTCSLVIGKGKGRKERKVKIPLELSLLINSFILKEKPEEERPLFSSRQNECVTKRRIQQLVKNISKEILNEEMNFRQLRAIAKKNIFARIKSLKKARVQLGLLPTPRRAKQEQNSEEKITYENRE
jgi:integrase